MSWLTQFFTISKGVVKNTLASENNRHREMLKGNNITKTVCPQGAHSLLVEKGPNTECLSFALTGDAVTILRQQATSYPFTQPSRFSLKERIERRASAVMEVIFYFKIKYGSN